MEFEQHIERREKYGQSLCLILKSINFCAVRWLPRILRIIDDYSKTTITELEAIMVCIYWKMKLTHFIHCTVSDRYHYDISGFEFISSYVLASGRQALEKN